MVKSPNLLDFYKNCQNRLKEIMACQKSQLLIYNHEKKTLTKLNLSESQLITIENPTGLIELCIEKRQILDVLEPMKHKCYNTQLDLESNLSLLTVPIIDNDSQNIIAVFQVVNLMNNIGRNYGKAEWIDKEVIDFLCEIIKICLHRFFF